jgi:hypothetical protein
MLLPLTQPPTSTAAVIAPLKSISVAASPATLAPSSALPTDSVSDLEPAESWVPPSSETSSTSSLSHRLDYISHTMYRSRQVLRLGRWLYDIPDVRESARELWYGHGAEEEKSMEQQESEEEWEEHERLPVVRAFGRRSSFEAGGLAKLMPHINTVGGLSVAGSPIASPFGLGGSAYSSNSLLSSSSSATPVALLTPGLRDQVGRGTFLFPLAAKSAAQGSESAERGQQQQSSSINTSVVVSDRKRARSSSLSDLASSDAEASAREEWRTSNAEEANEAAEATEEPAVEEEDDEGMTLLEWTVGVIDLTNSLMGLIIDASDDVEFIASLGVLPTRVGEVAGQISSYLWLVSGAIDVAMCGYKLRAYRREMREAIVEQLGLLREKEAARVDRLLEEASGSTELSPPVASSSSSSSQAGVLAASHGITLTPVPRSSSLSSPRHISTSTSPGSSVALSAASGPYSMYSSTTAAAVTVDETAKLLLARPKCLPASAAAGPQLTLCTAECDVDCFHIEYLRFFRYLGELGLSLCGVLIDEDIKDHPLQAVLEASGLFSGVATFIKRGATHARSKKLSKLNAAFMIRDDAGVPAQENGPPTEHEQLYS